MDSDNERREKKGPPTVEEVLAEFEALGARTAGNAVSSRWSANGPSAAADRESDALRRVASGIDDLCRRFRARLAGGTVSGACGFPHLCACGTGGSDPHLVGEGGCVRHMVAAPRPAGRHPSLGRDMWEVDGAVITDFSLRWQRGYVRHDCGCWSRSPGSSNSIMEGEDEG